MIASLVLISIGVRTVRADSDALMSVDPARVEAEQRKAAPNVKAEARPLPQQVAQDAPAPGVPAVEIQPGVIVLNTRGFNYGPPPAAIDPAAMGVEKKLQPKR